MANTLEGIRVLDLSGHMNGFYCSLLLADLGAEVIYLTYPKKAPFMVEVEKKLLLTQGRNKKSISLNLRSDKGMEIFTKLVKQSDVLISIYLPERAKHLKVDYDTLSKINPNMIYCSLTSYGQDGPYCNRVSHEIDTWGVPGILGIPGSFVDKPARLGIPVGILTANTFAFGCILAALLARPKIKRGQFLDVAATDCLFSWASVRAGDIMRTGTAPKWEERTDFLSPVSDIFDTKDGKRFILAAPDDALWSNFCEAVGRPDLAERFSSASQRNQHAKELHSIVQELMLTKTRDEWTELLSNKEVAFSPVEGLDEAFNDPHLKYRGLIKEMDYPGVGRVKQVAFPVKFSETPAEIRTPPPSAGQHTEEVLQTLGYNAKEIADFRQAGVI